MAWDFIVNSQLQEELADKLNTTADNFDEKTNNVYSQIQSMGDSWQGDDYDSFLQGVDNYKPALKDLSDGIRMFANKMNSLSEATETLNTNLRAILTNLIGSDMAEVTADQINTITYTNGETVSGNTDSLTDEINVNQEGNGNQGGGADGQVASNSNPPENAYTNAKTDYFIQRGDECVIDGKNMTFFGRDGSYNYYTDENGMVYVDDGGKLYSLDVNSDMFNIGYCKDLEGGWYGAVSASSSDAQSMGLPDASTIKSTNEDYNLTGMSEYVIYGTPDQASIGKPTIDQSFKEMVLAHQPVIQVSSTIDVPWTSGSDMKPDSTGYVTLVYDERAGLYYRLNENGTYERDMYGYEPERLCNWSIE